jgi:hypothetical protein
VFRVAGGQVVERWGNAKQAVFLEPLGDIDAGTRLPASIGMALERVVLEPGELASAQTGETRVLWLEQGTIVLSVDRISKGSIPLVRASGSVRGGVAVVTEGAEVSVAAGDLVALPNSAAYELRNDGPVTATAIVAAAYTPDAPHRTTPRLDPAYQVPGTPWTSGVAERTLATGSTTAMPQEPASARFGRITLVSGGRLPEFTAPGPLLLAVESGTVDVETAEGSAWVRDGAEGTTRTATSASLDAGDGAFVPPGAMVSFANLGDAPAGVLLVSLTSSASFHDR